MTVRLPTTPPPPTPGTPTSQRGPFLPFTTYKARFEITFSLLGKCLNWSEKTRLGFNRCMSAANHDQESDRRSESIPSGITKDHVIQAAAKFDQGVAHSFDDSIKYDVLYQGRRYPPKALLGIAAGLASGTQLAPGDFKGGEGSKCFRVLRSLGFEVVLKPGFEGPSAGWIFQGNPRNFDISAYLSRFPYIYWRCNRHVREIKSGDRCWLWRAGRDSGLIASGRVVEGPVSRELVKYPECLGTELWTDSFQDQSDALEVGIEIDYVRLDREAGMVERAAFTTDELLAQSTLITLRVGTVFKLSAVEVDRICRLWIPSDLAVLDLATGFTEGERRFRQHYARERNRGMVDLKKRDFAAKNAGRLFCEVCKFDFSQTYPRSLGGGFIEVHHLQPLSASDSPRQTKMEDLLLVCSNCHRMIHRTKSVDENLTLLLGHFQ